MIQRPLFHSDSVRFVTVYAPHLVAHTWGEICHPKSGLSNFEFSDLVAVENQPALVLLLTVLAIFVGLWLVKCMVLNTTLVGKHLRESDHGYSLGCEVLLER